jgi:CheY-like chemotaxis protein
MATLYSKILTPRQVYESCYMLMGNLYLLMRFLLLMKPDSKTHIVLIAEDEALVRQLSVDELEDAGYRVIEAANAGQALAILETGVRIDVLFTDVNMPGEIDGMGLVRMVHQRWPDVGLIVTSGRIDIADSDLPEEGHFIPKPYQPSTMCQIVGKLAAAR